MLRASALYIVIVIALVIAILCSALISVAYFYRQQNMHAFRYDVLSDNLVSGVNVLLVDTTGEYREGKIVSLFDGVADSVWLKRISWGIYDVGVVRAFIQNDTLTKVFSMACAIDSNKWAALYLPDEDRPVSLSGKTTVKGNAYLPKSGVREAYIDGKSYQGDKRLVIGKILNSVRALPHLNKARLNVLEQLINDKRLSNAIPVEDSVTSSFLQDTKIISAGKNVMTLEHVQLNGNILVKSDTTVIVGGDAGLSNVVVVAPYIKVKKGFKGQCQLIASDSIRIEEDCNFAYPSAIGIARFQSSKQAMPAAIYIGDKVNLTGCIFAFERDASREKQPLIHLGKNSRITGQVYTPGLLELKDGTMVHGSVFTARFLYRSGFTVFENYIVNTTIDAAALSRYYLASTLMPVVLPKRKVLQWLENE